MKYGFEGAGHCAGSGERHAAGSARASLSAIAIVAAAPLATQAAHSQLRSRKNEPFVMIVCQAFAARCNAAATFMFRWSISRALRRVPTKHALTPAPLLTSD